MSKVKLVPTSYVGKDIVLWYAIQSIISGFWSDDYVEQARRPSVFGTLTGGAHSDLIVKW